MKRLLHIYTPFASNQIKRSLAYKASFYLFILCSMFASFISYYLWMAIYGSADGATLGGLTRNEMIIYIFMTYVTSQLVMISISDNVSEDIVKGTVAMNLIKPIDYRLSLIATACGSMVYRFFAPCILVWIGLELYRVFGLGMPAVGFGNIIFFIISTIMSFLIYVLFDFCFGMIAFFTTYIFGMAMAKQALLSFLTGQLIPLSFFPEAVQRVFDFLPFSSMIYTPVMIYLGKYTGSQLMFVLSRQAVWVVLLYLFGSLIWRKVTKRLIVLGG